MKKLIIKLKRDFFANKQVKIKKRAFYGSFSISKEILKKINN